MRAFEDGPSLERFSLLRDAALVLADVFYMIRKQQKPEWFYTSGTMSHPTPHIARGLRRAFEQIASACDRRDVGQVVERLNAMRVAPTRLENFLASTRARDPIPPFDDAKWIYLARNKTEWGVVNLGEIEGRVQEALRELEELNPHFGRYNLAAAWRVHDLRAGYAISAMALQPWFIQTDFYDFRDFDHLADMRKKVTNALQNYRLLDGDPPYVSSSWSSEFFRNHTMRLELDPVGVDDDDHEAGPGFEP
ncbi:hypothetical protein HGP14_13320 [Rhizobium sp. P32RR-XVIII]|uniref:hypothetical protein n=1 Tax=Rhizobium sp. P32RR-XVIII TaxID=2726738 RepID=UPI001456FBD2|nr:hypothetical protein [Rhizobium sp. P32RR-XVIII]NLS04334.1 hypothetical protein [Rhizobium sp. P32RR-XVIII]